MTILNSCRSAEELICRLFEHGGLRLSRRQIRDIGHPAMSLFDSGALEKTNPPMEMACNACDEDHLVELDYDDRSRSYNYHCTRAGDIPVFIEDLRLFQLKEDWLRAWLQSGLQVLKPRTRELVPGALWDLGDAELGDRRWTAFLARAVDVNLDPILQALRTRGGKLSGLVFTTSDGAPWSLDLPNHHRFFPLIDALTTSGEDLVIDQPSILAALRCGYSHGNHGEPGRPSKKTKILRIFEQRRLKGTTASVVREEARQIREELMREDGCPEGIEVKSIERHIRPLFARPTVTIWKGAE